MLFYEIKVNYERQTADNTPGKVRETYLLEGVNCADVETRLVDEIKPYVFGELEVASCRRVQYYDIIESPSSDYWYKGRVELITVEDNGKETRKTVSILVQAADIASALKSLREHLSSLDCEIVSIQRSPIMELYHAVK
ncbi:MAG: DUF4494 domain-containing protein [Paludibacteraceae bacterium]|nr:DUF4494 domain-containing protein [Paludibacteraceae bacterium]